MKAEHKDERGRKYSYLVPHEYFEVAEGTLLGPPDVVDALELPEPFATRLHNQLYDRGLLSLRDIRKNPNSVQGALMAALRIDAQMIVEQYRLIDQDTLDIEEV